MISADLSPIANHLWQSTFFAIAAGLLTLALRKNRAAVRYGIWLAASIKFLIPFSLLVSLGTQLEPHQAPAIAPPQFANAVYEVAQPFVRSTHALPLSASPSQTIPEILVAVWLCGIVLGLIFWARLQWQLRAIRLDAIPLHLNLPIPALQAPAHTRLEPGVFGIFEPVLILPAGITHQLTPAQLDAVIAHELSHVRRQDNLTAAIHMLVEVIFWFHPFVWWIRERLVAEREQACDEEVVSAPHVYAEAILHVCKLYLKSPLVCMSGITGSNLKKRIAKIMIDRVACRLDWKRKLLLAVGGVAAVAAPVMVGTFNPPRVHAQSPAVLTPPLAFEVASVRRNENGGTPRLRYETAGIDFAGVPLAWIIGEAWHVPYSRISASDSRINDSFFSPTGTAFVYDISARADHAVSKEEIRLMLQTLLENRFGLTLHHEPKVVPVYKLVVAKGGPKLSESAVGGEPSGSLSLNGFVCRNLEIERLVSMLSLHMDRPVLDLTSLKGAYDFTLKAILPSEAGKTALSDWFSSSIFTDIRSQLGLQLEEDKAAVDYVVVDHVEQPSGN